MSTATKSVVPELFPLTIDGKIEWVKRGQYAKQAAETQAIKLKADIKKAHVEEMLDAAEKGVTEMNSEAPDEMKKTFDRVRSDWDDAVTHVEEMEAEAQEAKEKAEAEAKEKEENENALVLKAKDSHVSLADLSKTFDTGNMDRFIPKKDVDDATLLSALKAGMSMSEFSNWMIGDLVVALEDRQQLGVVAKLAESMGKAYANIYNAAKTARNVPPDKRTKGVSYTIFAEIANAKYSDKPEDHKKKMSELIDRAAAGKIESSQQARELKNAAAGKTAPAAKLPEENDKHEFIIIDHSQELVQVTVGFPRELFDNGALILDKRTGKQFQSFRAKPENRWSDLPIYKKPAVAENGASTTAAAPAAKVNGGNQFKKAKGSKK